MAIATILDPRYKMELIEYFFPLIYQERHSSEVERITELTNSLTKHYQLSLQAGQVSSQSSASPSSLPFDLDDDSLASFDLYVSSKKKKDSLKSELEDYLGEKLIPRTRTSLEFDIFEWWKVNGIRYPTLQAMARDILAIPVSTVASDLAFSTSGRVVSSHRSHLHADTLEALMCARDWMWNEMKAAGITSKGDCTFDDDFDLAETMKDNVTLYD
ncbi:zinc finger BED domain-containing protein DAYSLEEPER-like [Rosa chinensis]|uniref:zinc finger BED domain-containing protein DAYSLEEPER-like n=1 Tax=Rosa chinensis TaxID=74649 RepID=UPI000D0930D4|nr:zinc finger BED domain-containing protein DAYSLEEPER-like [Rosa chinensis]